MAITSKIERKGIDVVIEDLQQYTHPLLLGTWTGITTDDYQSYPRANKNWNAENRIAEVSLDKMDYTPVFTDDRKAVTSFWLVNDTRTFREGDKRVKASISVIFQVDLEQLYGVSHRADEQFNQEILTILRNDNFYINSDIDIIEGPDQVYSDLTLTGQLLQDIRLHDISKLHVVRFDMDVIYKPGCRPNITPVCPTGGSPVQTTFNGTGTGVNTPGGATLAINVVDAADGTTPLGTLTTNTSTEKKVEVTLPDVTNTATIWKTGRTISANAGDDGDIQRGQGVDHYNFTGVGSNPIFSQHSKRFTGSSGGYYDEVALNFKDVDGNVVTKSAAFPNGLVLVCNTYNSTDESVLVVDHNQLPATNTIAAKMLAAPYTIATFPNFYPLNMRELEEIFNYGIGNDWLNWEPFAYAITGLTSGRVASSTSVSNRYLTYVNDSVTNKVPESTICISYVGRYMTKTELGI